MLFIMRSGVGHTWAIAPKYIGQFKVVLSIFRVSAPTIQRDCPTLVWGVQEKQGIPVVKQRLIFAGMQLQGEKTVRENRITKGSVLSVWSPA